jgi:hypothetical protein
MDRKQAAKEFKERKVARGVFGVRCTATGETWVDSSPNLGAARNGLWFQLRTGLHRDKRLQSEWNAHGEASFDFEILETLGDDVSHINARDLLRNKKLEWAAKLNATALYA